MIDFTKPVQTRDGRKVTILTTEGREPWPIIGYVGSYPFPVCWTRTGGYTRHNTERPDSRDLIQSPPLKRTLWLNVFPGGIVTGPFYTKERADETAVIDNKDRRIDCIPVEVPTE